MPDYNPNPRALDRACQTCGVLNRERFVHNRTLWSPHQTLKLEKPTCASCFRAQLVANGRPLPEILGNVKPWVDEQLKDIGVSAEERTAKTSVIPPPILKALGSGIITHHLAGILPMEGRGILGAAKSGKTMAFAALLRNFLTQRAMNLNPFGPLQDISAIHWMNWPLTCEAWRLNGIDVRLEGNIRRASRVQLLILDDIGREVKRREHGEDVAQGHLDAIITARDRENLVTLWTSNLTEADLLERYGPCMTRRLFRQNPPVWISRT